MKTFLSLDIANNFPANILIFFFTSTSFFSPY
jgi:hypothetical protein